MRAIAVVTGTRAEYGILKPLIEKIEENPGLELRLYATGMHLLEEFGNSRAEIATDGHHIYGEVEMYAPEKGLGYHGLALSRGTEGFTEAFGVARPDIVVVLGDRLEPMAATLAAATLNIPVAHIHGGDRTDSGHIDESIRHSITRFAHIHLPATEGHAERLRRMGEEPWRITAVGALGLDSIASTEPLPPEELKENTGIDVEEPFIVCLFHPVSVSKEDSGKQMEVVMSAIKELGIQTVVIYPNNDAGSEAIIERIEELDGLPFVRAKPTLGHLNFISLLKYAGSNRGVLIGNSSSGIIEAPTMNVPVVNIGSRNTGRDHADNVDYVEVDRELIVAAVRKALDDDNYREEVRTCVNPYGEGDSANRIVGILASVQLDERLMLKRITY